MSRNTSPLLCSSCGVRLRLSAYRHTLSSFKPGGSCRCDGALERVLVALYHDAQPALLPFAEAIEKADAVAVAGSVHVLLELVRESLPLLLSWHCVQCLDRHPQCPVSGCQRARDDAPTAASQQLLRDREAGGIDRHRLLVAPLLHGLAEAVVWHEMVNRKPLVCAWRAETSLSEPVLDGTAAVGVAVLVLTSF